MESFMRLGLKEVSYVIKTLGICDDIPYLHGNVDIDGKLYIYEKKGNVLTITGEDGKSVKVGVSCTQQPAIDDHGEYYEWSKHEVKFEYGLDNGERLTFYKELGLNPGYEGFEDVNRHDLLHNTTNRYIDGKGREVASFSIEATMVHLLDSDKIYIFELLGKPFPVAVSYDDGEMHVSYTDTDEDMKNVMDVRNRILSGIEFHTIEPSTIEIVERKFRKDVFAYKEQQKKMKKGI